MTSASGLRWVLFVYVIVTRCQVVILVLLHGPRDLLHGPRDLTNCARVFYRDTYCTHVCDCDEDIIFTVLAVQIVRGLRYLHAERRIIHRDIKVTAILHTFI